MATAEEMEQAEQTVVRDAMSLDDFFALDIELVELVEGQPVLLSAATGPHQVAVTELLLRLVGSLPATHRVLTSPIDWVLWDGPRPTVRQPDLAVVTREQARERRLTEPPMLVVEVLSPSSIERDLVAKRRDYARAGCAHYWIVNLTVPEVVALHAEGDDYVEVARLVGGTTGTLHEPVEVTLDPRQLLA